MLGRSVLVVDDNPAMCKLVTFFLTSAGYQVQTAANGVEALVAVQWHRPDLVVLDLYMPVMDGERFVQELRQRGVWLKLLVFSADPDGYRAAARMHADGWIEKTGNPDALLDEVARLCAIDELSEAA